jgi:Ser/Thr protein kinase RdoA (MazF antagonist)
MKKDELIKIAKNFSIDGEPVKIEKCNSGHINKTYAITYKTKDDEQKKYILQYVNTNVFPNLPELMTNIKKITKYMNQKATEKGENTDRLTITMIDTLDENPNSIYNENWRMEEFIDNTKTYLTTESMEILEEAGKATGKFQKNLDGFPAEELYEIIPKFHYTPNRVNQLKEALSSKENNNKRKERFELAKDAIDFLTDEKRIGRTNIITDKLQSKEIPLRVTHNDTKLSNILFDKNTDEAVCLIDLDTVMPGALAYDFGEGLRTGITTAKEDEQDVSKIHADINRFEAFTKGFLSEVKEIITKEELEMLPLGVWMMTYENAIRFLADYLNGDVYFSVDKEIENHNLVRARAQMELLKQIEEKEDDMKGVIKKYGF